MNTIFNIFIEIWDLLLESSPYILFGLLCSALLRMFLKTEHVINHLGTGRIMPVLKAAFFGIPIPLCSCGVLPAAITLQKQGANKGATTAFLISTPESGIDSISITYALLDPIMTIARPFAGFIMGSCAGILENLLNRDLPTPTLQNTPNSCCTDNACKKDIPSSTQAEQHLHKTSNFSQSLKYAFIDVWEDMVVWFFIGISFAGLAMSIIPDDFFSNYLGSGLSAYFIMLLFGLPIYVCATASTPIAAALILKGVSPGAAIVFLLTGPATNITTITVLMGTLGKRTTTIYLSTIAILSVVIGLGVDTIYTLFAISPQATIRTAAEHMPLSLKYTSIFIVLLLSIKPLYSKIKKHITL